MNMCYLLYEFSIQVWKILVVIQIESLTAYWVSGSALVFPLNTITGSRAVPSAQEMPKTVVFCLFAPHDTRTVFLPISLTVLHFDGSDGNLLSSYF